MPMQRVLWQAPSWETKVRVTRSWFISLAIDLGGWAVGFGFDVAPIEFGIEFGPLFIGCERDGPSYGDLPNWSWTLRRIVLAKSKLELRLEADLNDWRFGYIMTDVHDHDFYLGPFNLLLEYDKF